MSENAHDSMDIAALVRDCLFASEHNAGYLRDEPGRALMACDRAAAISGEKSNISNALALRAGLHQQMEMA